MYSHRRTCQPIELNTVFSHLSTKKCSIVLDQYFDGKKISFNTNIIQHFPASFNTEAKHVPQIIFINVGQCWTLLDNWLGVVLEVGAKNWN